MGRIGNNSKLVLRHLTLSFPLGGDWQRLFPHSSAILPHHVDVAPNPTLLGSRAAALLVLIMEIELDDYISVN